MQDHYWFLQVSILLADDSSMSALPARRSCSLPLLVMTEIASVALLRLSLDLLAQIAIKRKIDIIVKRN